MSNRGALHCRGRRSVCGFVLLKDLFEESWDFEYRAIRMQGRIFPVLGKSCRLQQLLDCRDDFAEAFQRQPYISLCDPLCVVPLLRQRPSIALRNHWQLHRKRFGEAAGPRLADEKIGQVHVIGNLRGKSFDVGPNARISLTQRFRERLILPADENQLQIEIALITALGNFEHHLIAVSAEKHKPSRHVWLQAETYALNASLSCLGRIKARLQNHSGSVENLLVRMS